MFVGRGLLFLGRLSYKGGHGTHYDREYKQEQRMTTSLSFIIHFHVALGDMSPGNPHPFVASMWSSLVYWVTWCCLPVVVVGVGGSHEGLFGC
jgi:hypothetical protein